MLIINLLIIKYVCINGMVYKYSSTDYLGPVLYGMFILQYEFFRIINQQFCFSGIYSEHHLGQVNMDNLKIILFTYFKDIKSCRISQFREFIFEFEFCPVSHVIPFLPRLFIPFKGRDYLVNISEYLMLFNVFTLSLMSFNFYF